MTTGGKKLLLALRGGEDLGSNPGLGEYLFTLPIDMIQRMVLKEVLHNKILPKLV
jgi:hypothetical protein